MSATTRIRPIAALTVILFSATALIGCGTSIADLCDDVCDCEGCSDAEYDECVEEGEDFEDTAEDAGCGSEFDDYVDCIADSSSCVDGEFDADEECVRELATCGALYQED